MLNLHLRYLPCVYSIVLLGIASTSTVRANVFGLFTYTDNGNSITITGYPSNAAGPVEIPAAIVGKPVASIGDEAFKNCTGLTSVMIPDSVTSIAGNAFNDCSSLITITVEPLNSNFASADGVLFDKNMTSLIRCPSGKLGSYTIPNSVTSIGGAFYRCSRLTSVTIPNSMTSIGHYAFESCYGLTSVTISNSVTSIGFEAFRSCYNLPSVTIPSSITSIGGSAFSGCSKLITIYLKGNAPALGTTVFAANPESSVYYLSGKTGWTSTYGGLPTVALGLPTIVAQVPSVITNAAENVGFTVIAKTTFPLTLSYQWQRNGLAIPGATGSSLYLNNIQPTDIGTYSVIITNDTGSILNAATLTLTQGPLYTQAQYETALQTGLNTGMAVGIAAGRTQVTDFPNNFNLYSLTQVQALHVGAPLLIKDQVSGKFKLTIGVKRSSDLSTFVPFPIPTGAAVLNPQGEMEFQFTSPDNATFYRLESH